MWCPTCLVMANCLSSKFKKIVFPVLKGENSILHLNFLVAHLNLAIIYASQGRYADAEKVIVFMLLHVNCNVYWIET